MHSVIQLLRLLRKILIAGRIAGIAAGLACAGFVSAQPPPAPVVVADVVRGKVQATLRFSGTLISLNEAVLSAETAGRVTYVAKIGTRFSRGGAVAQLDDTLLQQMLEENRADIQSRQERIRFLVKEVRRLQALAENKNAAISLLEETQASLGVTRSELTAASARVAQTEERIRRSKIVAPFAGVISGVHTEIGEWTSVGDPVAELVNTEALEIETHVPASVLPHVSVGDPIEVIAANTVHRATLQVIVPVGDKASRLFELRLAPRGQIGPPGLPVQVRVPADSPRDGLLVPEDALVIRHDGISVFRVEADMTASRIPVKTGLSATDGLIEIAGGLEAGDKIVIRGGERLRHGASVRLVSPVHGNRNGDEDNS